MLYTIGETAKQLGLAPSTLRYYDKEGLLPFIERSQSGIRMFKETDLESLKVIECLKETGMSIRDIRAFIFMVMDGDATIEQRLALFLRRREEVEKQLKQLQETLDTINYKCWYYEEAKQQGGCDGIEQLPDEALPPALVAVRNRLRCE